MNVVRTQMVVLKCVITLKEVSLVDVTISIVFIVILLSTTNYIHKDVILFL